MACLSKYFFSLGVHPLHEFSWILFLLSTPNHDLYLHIRLFCDLLSKSWWVGKPLMMISVVIVTENDSGRKKYILMLTWLKWIIFHKEFLSIIFIVTLAHLNIYYIQGAISCGLPRSVSWVENLQQNCLFERDYVLTFTEG